MAYRYTDDVVKLYIPKTLIESFDGHPEPYGDRMITLINGMYTDIFEDEQGIYTLTNDLDLVEYIESKGGVHARKR
jgi:hypothetical protein